MLKGNKRKAVHQMMTALGRQYFEPDLQTRLFLIKELMGRMKPARYDYQEEEVEV